MIRWIGVWLGMWVGVGWGAPMGGDGPPTWELFAFMGRHAGVGVGWRVTPQWSLHASMGRLRDYTRGDGLIATYVSYERARSFSLMGRWRSDWAPDRPPVCGIGGVYWSVGVSHVRMKGVRVGRYEDPERDEPVFADSLYRLPREYARRWTGWDPVIGAGAYWRLAEGWKLWVGLEGRLPLTYRKFPYGMVFWWGSRVGIEAAFQVKKIGWND